MRSLLGIDPDALTQPVWSDFHLNGAPEPIIQPHYPPDLTGGAVAFGLIGAAQGMLKFTIAGQEVIRQGPSLKGQCADTLSG